VIRSGGRPQAIKFALEIYAAVSNLDAVSRLKFQARRATIEDLPRLKELWTLMQLDGVNLEHELTDCQVVAAPEGNVVGCLTFTMAQRQGWLHSEAFEDYGLAEAARPALWERLQTLAQNHGLVRLWTREQSPFWTHNLFRPATATELAKLAPGWDRNARGWLTVPLKDEDAIAVAEKELALFAEFGKRQTEQALGPVRVLKRILLAGIIILALLFFGAMLWLLISRRGGGLGLVP
jgi:N-acetylglutamate synthase-like GNAT family acetyltransferase